MMNLEELIVSSTGSTPNIVNFASVIPGMEMTFLIGEITRYCKKHDVVATLDFNGITNRIEHWVDPATLAGVWFRRPNDQWYDRHKMNRRNEKINEVLGSCERPDSSKFGDVDEY